MKIDKEGDSANCTYFYFLDVIKKKRSRLKDGVWDLCRSMVNDLCIVIQNGCKDVSGLHSKYY